MALNVNTSVVDYLKSAGQDSSFANRTNLYKSYNLNMGNYTGSANQNIALLNAIKGGGSSGGTTTPTSPQAGSLSGGASVPTSASPNMDFVTSITDQLLNSDKQYQSKVQDAQQKLMDFYAGLESPESRFNRYREEQGVNQQAELVNAITKNVMNTEDTIDNLDESVTQRSKDFLINESDRVGILAKERQPHIEALNKLLRSKQYEEIGLASKENMVRDLVNLSLQGDELRSKPLQLGVDYSVQERDYARSLLSEVVGAKTQAFQADFNYNTDERRRQEDMNFEKQMTDLKFKQDQALKSTSQATSNKTTAAKKVTDDAWNIILSNVNGASVSRVRQAVEKFTDKMKSKGVDVNEIWSRVLELEARYGKDGTFSRGDTKDAGDWTSLLKE